MYDSSEHVRRLFKPRASSRNPVILILCASYHTCLFASHTMSSVLQGSGVTIAPPSRPTLTGMSSSYPTGPSLHPTIQHHTLASSLSTTPVNTQSSSLPFTLNTRTVLLSTAVLSASAFTLYHLSRVYTVRSTFPFLVRRSTPLTDPIVGVHALADINRYTSNHILIPNPQSYITKRQQLIAAGPTALQVISDFDHTLSSFTSLSSHGTLEHSSELPVDYMPKVQALFDHYYPIEMDHSISRQQKEAAMVEWWEAAHALLLEYRFNRSFITAAVQQAITQNKLTYRPGASATIHYCHRHAIPLLVFSAGLGDTISEFMRQSGTKLSNVDVVSNFMRFDESTGTLVAFEADLIHSLNKNYSHVLRQRADRRSGTGGGSGSGSEEVVDELHAPQRRNVILLGDSVGDVQMSVGLEDVNVILRVGWLNGVWPVEEEKRVKYEAVYDVLIGNNGGMEFVLELLESICESSVVRT